MLARFISPVLIAAVIACPLSCGQSVCCDSQSCADDDRAAAAQCSQTARVQPTAANCNCCVPSSDERGQPEPQPCPDKSACQGICGGAVFEKLCHLSIAETQFVLPPASSDSTFVLRPSVCPTDRFGFFDSVTAGNQGRFVRILHMSLTC